MKKKVLRASRYLTTRNEPLARFIIEKLPYLDYIETLRWYTKIVPHLDLKGRALLGCNDRFFLLSALLGRKDVLHPWLFDRAREVEAESDGYIDLWARFHGKSSIITNAGIIQEVLVDPEITIAIFSVTKPIAQTFLSQIKEEFESNGHLKEVYSDVLYQAPRTNGPDGRPSKWGIARGITVKRRNNPKEATIEAHGLIDGQPVGRHFHMHVYDDVVTQDYLAEEQLKKTTLRWEMADNLGTKDGVRKWVIGTRYHFADTYGVIIERMSAKARIYPATDNGKLDGQPVLLTQDRWETIKRDQRSIVAAQMLLNPLSTTDATFKSEWMKNYDVIPAVMNVYILVDPSKGSGQRSDRTAIAVIGIDQGSNKYLLDGVRHRMKLSERWELVKSFKDKWEHHPGVQMVKVGWERYGKDVELEVIADQQQRENNYFEIEELNTPRQGGRSKDDRIERLEPDIREGRFYLPALVHNSDAGGLCFWSVWTEDSAELLRKKIEEARSAGNHERANTLAKGNEFKVGQIIYRPARGLTKRQRQCEDTEQKYRIVTALKRRDENNDVYDVTRAFIEEAIRHPFASHDDLIDAASRIFDIDPMPPIVLEAQSTESIDAEAAEGADE